MTRDLIAVSRECSPKIRVHVLLKSSSKNRLLACLACPRYQNLAPITSISSNV